jgi:hypothetical protein
VNLIETHGVRLTPPDLRVEGYVLRLSSFRAHTDLYLSLFVSLSLSHTNINHFSQVTRVEGPDGAGQTGLDVPMSTTSELAISLKKAAKGVASSAYRLQMAGALSPFDFAHHSPLDLAPSLLLTAHTIAVCAIAGASRQRVLYRRPTGPDRVRLPSHTLSSHTTAVCAF